MSNYQIIFDGGSLGNPGKGYGSFRIEGPAGYAVHRQLQFGDYEDRVTNNQAEYLSLIHALSHLRADLGARAAGVTVQINGDSQLVINQINGAWKVRNPDLRGLLDQAKALMLDFGAVHATWHPRERSVAVLGH